MQEENKPPLNIICLADIEEENVEWLWKPYIPLGKITVVQGDPGVGKTYLTTTLAAIISNGSPFPYAENTEKPEPGKVIFQTAEDGLGDTIKVRLNKAKADSLNIHSIDESTESLTLDDTRLREAMQLIRPKLVVIDPLQAYLGAEVDMHRANEIRPVMARLGNLAAEFKCAIILIGHQNKASGGKNIYRGLGSIDIAAAARSVLVICEMPNEKNKRAVVQIKSSLAQNGQTILFELDPSLGFLWAGTSELSADEILNPVRIAPERDDCVEFMTELLADGALPANKVWEVTKANGYAEATVKRAKEKAKIISFKDKGKGGGWVWQLKESHTKKRDTLDTVDTLTNKEYQVYQEVHVKKSDTLIDLPTELPYPYF